jgi:hypothetical protein
MFSGGEKLWLEFPSSGTQIFMLKKICGQKTVFLTDWWPFTRLSPLALKKQPGKRWLDGVG